MHEVFEPVAAMTGEINRKEVKHDVILLVSKWCEECVPADNAWKRLYEERKDFRYRSLDVSEPEGRRLSIELYIRSVPSTVIDGKLSYVGIPTKEDADELLNLA
ncbi:MAG: thioredoxin family protein [Deltaproteobacteria bacterium]|nr:thioredoxin family protein [Deltaproteobacteria bacterium]